MLPGHSSYQPPKRKAPSGRKGKLRKRIRIRRRTSWAWGKNKDAPESIAGQIFAAPLVAAGTLFWAGYKGGEAAVKGASAIGRGALGLLALGARGVVIGGKRYGQYVTRPREGVFAPRTDQGKFAPRPHKAAMATEGPEPDFDSSLGSFGLEDTSPSGFSPFRGGPSARGGSFSSGGA